MYPMQRNILRLLQDTTLMAGFCQMILLRRWEGCFMFHRHGLPIKAPVALACWLTPPSLHPRKRAGKTTWMDSFNQPRWRGETKERADSWKLKSHAKYVAAMARHERGGWICWLTLRVSVLQWWDFGCSFPIVFVAEPHWLNYRDTSKS